MCRASWLVKKQVGASEDIVTIGLMPAKQNDGQRYQPAGFTLEFTGKAGPITVTPTNLATVDGLSKGLSLHARIAHALKQGPMTYQLLAETLEAKQDSIIKAVTRSTSFTKVLGSDGVHRLALVENRRIA